jgi:DNA repair exonuclease SbcCD ATPase subunit
MNLENLDNPYIQVVWEDTAENFTQEKIKSVKQYFQKKYSSTNVNVITKVKTNNAEYEQQTIDVSFNILDKNYQLELVRRFLKSKGYEQYQDKLNELDSKVENVIASTTEELTSFKKWYIKKIEFSNFLSFGDNQVLDFEKYNGIIAIESSPVNFGGKTILSVDLLLFLFFNSTTKTTKVEDIFNKYTDKDYVKVKGEINIDGDDYIIERQLERKKNRSGDYTVKSSLEFFRKLPNGELQNFTGEQRKETEKFIKNSIGDEQDFLMTILTTASNLEELLEAKPTTRGQILSRFLGLEFLKKKEEVGKQIYQEFSKGMLSNIYNVEKLKQDNEALEIEISTITDSINDAKVNVVQIDEKLNVGKEYKDNLLSMKNENIEHDLLILKPDDIQTDIDSLLFKIDKTKKEIDSFEMNEPKEFYHEDEHDDIKEKISTQNKLKSMVDIKIMGLEQLKSKVSNNIKCEHCGIELMNAEITQSKLAELDALKAESQEHANVLKTLNEKEKSLTNLKNAFFEYEKRKLVKSKMELTLESEELKLSKKTDLLARYRDVKEKIEKNKQLENQIIKANLRISELEIEKRKLELLITSNQVQANNKSEKISNNLSTIEKIKKEQEEEKIYKVYSEIYGKNGISKHIMKTLMPIINSELQRLLQDSALFKLEIRISDKNEVEFWMIDNSSGIEKLMISGSGYEKTVASLALRSVLSRVCSLPKPNIVVMDEVFGKVANEHLEMVGEFFIKTKEYFEKIFLITHNPLVTNWADNVIKVEKTENVSRIIS